MAWQGMNILAVVPARGGSKSIPRKNLALVGGLSLVGHAAKVVSALPWINRAILSTDDQEIAEEGRRHGLLVPFMRPEELAGDRSTSVDMWRHAWLASEDYFGDRFDISILLEPTSPLRRPEDVERTIRILAEGGHAAAATVSRTPAHYTPHKTLTINENGLIGFYLPEGARHSLRQSIPPYYHRNGVCYAVRRATLVEKAYILEQDCAAVVIERPVINIDEELDLRIADILATD
jgi:CMP-N-acetylneuraminic acid synthetase